MKEKIKIMILIILECRLSLKMSAKLFNMTEEEILELFKNDNFAFRNEEALKYLFYYETALPNESRDRKALFKGVCYKNKIKRILSNPNLEEKKREYQELIDYLTDAEIIEFMSINPRVRAKLWTKERKKAFIKFKLKNAISTRDLEKYYSIDHHDFATRWAMELEDEELKERLNLLNQYLYDKSAVGRRRKKYS